MLENLLKLVQENAQSAIVNNTQVPNEHNEAAINETANAVKEGMANAFAGGQTQDLLGMFAAGGGNLQNNPIAQNIISQLTGNLSTKLGIDANAASGIASSLIPVVLNQFVNKTNDPNDNSFNITDVMNTVSGGKAGGMDLGNLANQFLGGGDNKGGIGDALKGLF
jgi:hypothetical protein